MSGVVFDTRGCCTGCEYCYGYALGCHQDPCTCAPPTRPDRDRHARLVATPIERQDLRRANGVAGRSGRGSDAPAATALDRSAS